MLLCFSRDYLHREGDLVKHLGYLGYTVTHVQVWFIAFLFIILSRKPRVLVSLDMNNKTPAEMLPFSSFCILMTLAFSPIRRIQSAL